MKAVVLEVKNNYAAVLSDDGIVSRVENNKFMVGQVIQMKENKVAKFSRKTAMLIASVAGVAFLFTLSAFAYFTPVTYVSMDVNPSIEFSLNVADTVVDAQGANDDGTALLKNIKITIKGKNIEDAIKATVDELINEGYIASDENGGIEISTSNKNEKKAQELAKELEENTQDYVDEKGAVATVEAIGVGKIRVDEARKLGVTPGKLNLLEKLQASFGSSENFNMDDWINKSVKDINKTIKENRKAHKATGENELASGENATDENVTGENTPATGENKPPKTNNKPTIKNNPKNTDKATVTSAPTATSTATPAKTATASTTQKDNKSNNGKSNNTVTPTPAPATLPEDNVTNPPSKGNSSNAPGKNKK